MTCKYTIEVITAFPAKLQYSTDFSPKIFFVLTLFIVAVVCSSTAVFGDKFQKLFDTNSRLFGTSLHLRVCAKQIFSRAAFTTKGMAMQSLFVIACCIFAKDDVYTANVHAPIRDRSWSLKIHAKSVLPESQRRRIRDHLQWNASLLKGPAKVCKTTFTSRGSRRFGATDRSAASAADYSANRGPSVFTEMSLQITKQTSRRVENWKRSPWHHARRFGERIDRHLWHSQAAAHQLAERVNLHLYLLGRGFQSRFLFANSNAKKTKDYMKTSPAKHDCNHQKHAFNMRSWRYYINPPAKFTFFILLFCFTLFHFFIQWHFSPARPESARGACS